MNNAAVGAADFKQFEQEKAEAHAAHLRLPDLLTRSNLPRNSTSQRLQVSKFDSPAAEFQEVMRQMAIFTALLQRMRQEGEAVQLKVANVEKFAAPAAEPWQPRLSTAAAECSGGAWRPTMQR